MNKSSNAALFLFLLVTVTLLDIAISLRSLPITDGWWEAYARMMREGAVPYLDFKLRLPPLWLYYNYNIRNILGDGYLINRISTIPLHILTIGIVYTWLRLSSGIVPSIIGAAVVAAIQFHNPTYIVKDYHAFVDFDIAISLLLYTKTILCIHKKPRHITLLVLFTGMTIGLLILTKHNIGIFYGIPLIALLAVERWQKDSYIRISYLISISVFGCLLILFSFSYFINNYWTNIFFNLDSKGSLLHVLFRFIVDPDCGKIDKLLITILLTGFVFVNLSNTKYIMNGLKKVQYSLGRTITINERVQIVILLLTIVFLLRHQGLLMASALAGPVLIYFRSSDSDRKYFLSLNAPLYLLVYCGTQTAGYNLSSMQYLIASLICFLINRFSAKIEPKAGLIIVSSVLMIAAYDKITKNAYSWWGYSTGSILSNKSETSIPQFNGIKTDNQTAAIYETINKIKLGIGEKEKVFAYPNIPILYEILGKQTSNHPILWFDFANEAEGIDAIETLTQNKPEYIFWLKPPGAVYYGHYQLIKSKTAIDIVDTWLMHMTTTGQYEVLESIPTFSDSPPDYNSDNSSNTIQIPSVLVNDALLQKIDACTIRLECYTDQPPHDSTSRTIVKISFTTNELLADFIRSTKLILKSKEHVFYVLRRNSDEKN